MINLIEYGFNPTFLSSDASGMVARVTAVHKERFELISENGVTHGRLKASIYYGDKNELFPATGDFVLIQYNDSGDSQIIKTLKRKSVFSRNNTSRAKEGHTNAVNEQVVAANFDYVFIMASLNQDFNVKRIERYLALAWQSGAIPVIILTKADIVEDYTAQIRAVEKIAMGVGIYAVSSKTGYGLSELADYLKPRKTIVFLGSSGVGKSSLVNELAKRDGHEEDIMAVSEIREEDSKGRHTTTHRQLIKLNSGVMIIDTPGMRELGLMNVSEGLSQSFSDVEQYFGQCRFTDCRHQNEPGCAVKAALDDGELTYDRWQSYLKLKKEAKFVDDKEGYLRAKEAWGKSISIHHKNVNKYGGKK